MTCHEWRACPVFVGVSTDPLVEALATRLRLLDLYGWRQIARWAEESQLSFEDLRLLLALALQSDDGATTVSDLAELAGLPLDVAYPATHSLHGRGYLREERREYAVTPRGQELLASLDAAHREGIQSYVNTLDRVERGRLMSAFVDAR